MLQTETQQDKCWPYGPRGLCADSTSTSELLFASILDQIFVQNILTNSFATKVKVSYSSMSWRKVPLIKIATTLSLQEKIRKIGKIEFAI